MAVHIFSVNEENYKICVQRGLVALPEPKDSIKKNNIFDALLSRLACVKSDDYILMYVFDGGQELRGIWQADGEPFYEETNVWPDRIYPFRCRIKVSQYCFQNYLKLYDINDLINTERIWTWSLTRATGSNSMFSISDSEFRVLLDEFFKINPFSIEKAIIPEPYPYRNNNTLELVHYEKDLPKYEYSVMTLLNDSFSKGRFRDIFGNYNDFLSYVPTNRGREMDIMLMYGNPDNHNKIMSYDIIEVKRAEFDRKALAQLIDYESWFLQKKVSGDLKMIRTTAIAKSFTEEVLDYVEKRKSIENKPIKLIQYNCCKEIGFTLQKIN